jgi:hypothetical protein
LSGASMFTKKFIRRLKATSMFMALFVARIEIPSCSSNF